MPGEFTSNIEDLQTLGATTGLITAGKFFGISRNTAYRLAEQEAAEDLPERIRQAYKKSPELRFRARWRLPSSPTSMRHTDRDGRGIGGGVLSPPRAVHDCGDHEDDLVLDLAAEVGALLIIRKDID